MITITFITDTTAEITDSDTTKTITVVLTEPKASFALGIITSDSIESIIPMSEVHKTLHEVDLFSPTVGGVQ